MVDFNRLNDLFMESGVTKASVARKINKSRAVFNDWEKGKSKPSDSDLEIVAQSLNTTVAYLKGETDIRKALSPEEESALNDRLKLLHELTKDFSQEQFDLLIQQVHLFGDAWRAKDNR